MIYNKLIVSNKMPKLYNDYLIGTTRFNQKTASENKSWRDRREWKGCIYGVPKLICRTVPNSIQIIVIESVRSLNGFKQRNCFYSTFKKNSFSNYILLNIIKQLC